MYGGIRRKPVGHVYERDIHSQTLRKRIILMCKPESLAYASTHKNAVHSMTKALFRH